VNLEIISRYPASGENSKHLLFVHGSWHGAWCWDKYFLPYFASKGFAAHALSLRGHGNSEGKGRLWRTRIVDYVNDVVSVVEQLPESPVVIGHSLGGFVVQKFLEHYTAPAGVLITSPPPNGMFLPLLRLAMRKPFAFTKSVITLKTKALVETPSLVRELLFTIDTQEQKVIDCWKNLTEEAIPAFLDMLIFNLVKPALVKVPMMVIGSYGDSFFKPHDIKQAAIAYKTKPIFFESTGHDVMLEDGWLDVASRIIMWLDNISLVCNK
jgi:pimeloyl-ACP methyl ester carboxylesterase